MSKRYHPDHKALALKFLDLNNGNIVRTSQETAIPPRTLSAWRLERQRAVQLLHEFKFAQQQQQPPSQPPLDDAVEALPISDNDEFAGDLEDLRQQLMKDAFGLAASLSTDILDAPFNQRSAALTQIIDRVMKLTVMMPPPNNEHEQVIRIEYIDPDGSLHNTPVWKRRPIWQQVFNNHLTEAETADDK